MRLPQNGDGGTVFSYLIYRMQKYRTTTVVVDGSEFRAIIADTFMKKMIGLMHRTGIGDDECMLFKFAGEGSHPIWMYSMKFPIDTVWLDSGKRVVHIEEDMPPCKSLFNCRQYGTDAISMYVIEFRKGTVAKHRISTSSRISLDI